MKKITIIILAIVGILLIVFGIYCLCHPAETLLSSAWLLGLATLVSGILLGVFALRSQMFLPNSATRFLHAVLLVILGVFFLTNKGAVSTAIPIAFSVWVLLEGVILAVNSFDYKKAGFPAWFCILLLGIVALVLGFLGLRNPEMAGKTLSSLLGWGIISAGVSYLVAMFGLGLFEKEI